MAELAGWQGVPLVLTRVGLEAPAVAATVAEFLAAAAQVEVRAIDAVLGHLGG